MSTKDHLRQFAAMSRRIGKQTWDPDLATMFEKIAAEYDLRADEESRGDEPPSDQK